MKYSDISDLSSITKLTLNVNREGSCGAYNLTVYAKQNDSSSRYIEAEIRTGDKVLEIPGTAAARIRCTKPDGKSVINDGCIYKGKIYVELSAQILAVPGIVKADIGIYDGETVLSTASFDIEVIEAPFDESKVCSENEFSALTEALNRANNIHKTEAELKDARKDIEGKTHESAGEAIRRQMLSVKNDLSTLETIDTVHGEIISVSDAVSPDIRALKIYGSSTQDGEPSMEKPAAITGICCGGTVDVNIFGKNLAENMGKSRIHNGVTWTLNADGSITANGTAIERSEFILTKPDSLFLPKGEYTLSGCPKNDGTNGYYLAYTTYNEDNAALNPSKYDYGKSGGVAVQAGVSDYAFIACRVKAGYTVNNITFYPQLEAGSAATEYEQAKPEQRVLLSTPNGMLGVPVSAGGDYTDDKGQQWVCDEIDLERGVKIQRINRVLLVGDETFTWYNVEDTPFGGIIHYMLGEQKANPACNNYAISTRFINNSKAAVEYGHGTFHITATGQRLYFCIEGVNADNVSTAAKEWFRTHHTEVIYVLENPIETPLSEEELAACRALHINTPSTVILSDEPVGKSLTYSARAASYVERKVRHSAAKVMSGIISDEMKAYRADSLDCLASYLAYQAGSSCVVGTPQLDENVPMFFAVYDTQKGYENLFYSGNDNVFTFNVETEFEGKNYPVFYGDCETFVSLLTKCIKYEDSAYCYGFNNPDIAELKESDRLNALLPYAKESGDYPEKPYTFDFRNLYSQSVATTAYATSKMGNPLYTLCSINNGEAVWDESVFELMETGDIMYCGYVEDIVRYRNIGHIMYFIKDLGDLNKYGKQYGITFRPIVENEESLNGRHGYLAEIGGDINGKDVIRIRSIEGTIKAHTPGGTASKNVYNALYVQKPQSNIFTSTKAYNEITKVIDTPGEASAE